MWLACVAACSSYGSARDTPADGGAGGDGGDGGEDASTPDAPTGADGGGNLLVNGDFEDASGAGCGLGWTTTNGTLTLTTHAHGGMHACEVCVTGVTSILAEPTTIPMPVVGDWYSAEAWFSTVADASVDLFAIQFENAATVIGYARGDAKAAPGGWQRVQIANTRVPSTQAIRFAVHVITDAGATGCVDFDDVVVTKQ
jgi:hypothetical protein